MTCCFCGKPTTPDDRQHTNWPDVCKSCYEARKNQAAPPAKERKK